MAETPSTSGSKAESSADPQQVGVEAASSTPSPEPVITAEVAADPAPAASAATPGPEPTVAVEPAAAVPPPQPPEPPAAEPSAAEPPAATSAPAPAEAPAPAQPAGVAASLSVPPLDEEPGSGGEWELLVSRVQGWLGSGEPQQKWQKIRGPLKGAAILIGVILALRVYSTAVHTIDSIPVVSGLLELAGLIASLQFVVSRLVRARDRDQVIGQLKSRWQDFRGRS